MGVMCFRKLDKVSAKWFAILNKTLKAKLLGGDTPSLTGENCYFRKKDHQG